MEFSAELVKSVAHLFVKALIERVGQQPHCTIADLEQGLRQLLKDCGKEALSQSLTGLENQYPAAQVVCSCGYQADVMFRRSAKP